MIKNHYLICLFISLISLSLNAETVLEQKSTENLNNKELNWFSLRIPESEYTSSHQDQRTFKLKAHKHLAHTTLLLTAGTLVTAVMAKRDINRNRAARGHTMLPQDADELKLHMALAGATLLSYYTTAYFSITAPKSEAMIDSENLKWHKRFSYIHMPGMILAPVLGLMAYNDYKKGKNPTGIAKMHRPVMALTSLALLGAVISIEF